jgi:hypothetical protein
MAIMSMPFTASAVSFSDTSGHWAQSVISKWTDQGVIVGYGDGKFHPDDYLTRAQYGSILCQIFQYSAQATNVYPELTASAWYTPIFLKLIAAGIVSPDNSGRLNPNSPISRGDMMVWTAKAYQIAPVGGNTTFLDDSSIPADQKPYIKALQLLGMIVGYSVNGGYEVRAGQSLTRAEGVQVIDQADSGYSNANTNGTIPTPSNPATWAPVRTPGFGGGIWTGNGYFNISGGSLTIPGLSPASASALGY